MRLPCLVGSSVTHRVCHVDVKLWLRMRKHPKSKLLKSRDAMVKRRRLPTWVYLVLLKIESKIGHVRPACQGFTNQNMSGSIGNAVCETQGRTRGLQRLPDSAMIKK